MSVLHTTPDKGTVAPAPSGEPPAGPASPAAAPAQAGQRVRSTRTGRTWVAVCAGALITVALIIFMLQNTHTVQVNFLGLTGSTSLALMLDRKERRVGKERAAWPNASTVDNQ